MSFSSDILTSFSEKFLFFGKNLKNSNFHVILFVLKLFQSYQSFVEVSKEPIPIKKRRFFQTPSNSVYCFRGVNSLLKVVGQVVMRRTFYSAKIWGGQLQPLYWRPCLFNTVCRPVVPGCAGCAKASLADQLTLFQPGGTDYAHLISTGTPGFSDPPTALTFQTKNYFLKIEIMIDLCLAKTRLD